MKISEYFNMNSLVTGEFRLVMLPLKNRPQAHASYYRQSLELWEQVWTQVNQKFEVSSPLFIDGFLRQDEAACIFTPNSCLGMIFFRTLDFAVMDYKNDSYFKEYTDLDRSKLLKHGKCAFLASFLTVDQRFRNFSPEVRFKEVFLDIMVMRFLEGEADVISGITRRDRGINDVSFGLGATPIRENVPYFEGRESVDLVAFYRKDVKRSSNPPVRAFTDKLWETRLDLTKAQDNVRINAA